MKVFLNETRKPTELSFTRKIIYSGSIFIIGVLLGLTSKFLDEAASNVLPFLLETMDLGNFFSRMGVWIFIAIVISLYSKSPRRAAVNVFLFFVGMVGSYYFYTVTIAGFFPKSYMMIWLVMTIVSPVLAFGCWYVKDQAFMAIMISSIILMFMARQAFAFGFWYFDIRYSLEFLLLIAKTIILYQSPKQIIKVVALGMFLFFLTAQMNIFWGML